MRFVKNNFWLLLLISSLCFSQQDSSFHRWSISINPGLFIPNPVTYGEYGVISEFKFNEKRSIEFGGGYNFIPVSSKSQYYIKDYGYTIRVGFKVSYDKDESIDGKKIYYNELLLFYRHMNYFDRTYYQDAGSILETRPLLQLGEAKAVFAGDEVKEVLAFEFLFGRHVYFGKWLMVDLYSGFGARIKARVIYHCNRNSSSYCANPVKDQKTLINNFAISLHAGLKIGFVF